MNDVHDVPVGRPRFAHGLQDAWRRQTIGQSLNPGDPSLRIIDWWRWLVSFSPAALGLYPSSAGNAFPAGEVAKSVVAVRRSLVSRKLASRLIEGTQA